MSKPTPDPECLRFLRGLAGNEQPLVTIDRLRGYLYLAKLRYRLVTVRLTYNAIREIWNLDVRDERTLKALYGHYVTWDRPGSATLDFLLDSHGIGAEIRRLVAVDEARDREDKRKADELRGTYLGAGRTEP